MIKVVLWSVKSSCCPQMVTWVVNGQVGCKWSSKRQVESSSYALCDLCRNDMSQRSEASRNSEQVRDIYAFVDMVRERRQEQEESEETEPTMDTQQPPQQEEEESEPTEDPSNGDGARSVASSQPMRRLPTPPQPLSAPRAPTPPRRNAAMNVSDGRFPTHDPYFHPRLPRNHPYHLGPRLGENPHRPVYGIPPPPSVGMTREERERVWDIAGGLRDARVRVRHQEVMMERTLGAMRRMGEDTGMVINGVRRIYEVIFIMGCILAAVCSMVITLVLRK